MTTAKKTGLELLREPFPDNQVSQLPKGTKAQNDCPPSEKINCKICGGWHHPKVIHLSYVGHAALTDRLLDADPAWTWEPLALKDGLPAFDLTGGLWIRLTVCGLTRIGYGHAASSQYKEIGSREKEVIGDALRNAAMRFGAALDLWHKGDLHVEDEGENAANGQGETLKPKSSKSPAPPFPNTEPDVPCEYPEFDRPPLAPVTVAKDEVVGMVENVESKEGEKNGRPWTLYAVTVGGVKYKTFSDTFADMATTAKGEGQKVKIKYRDSGRGMSIALLEVIE